MIVTIHQPEHLPWIGFFHKMAKSDMMVILDQVDYRKNYFQNRNQILTTNGPTYVTVPVAVSQSKSKRIMDILISGDAFKKKYMKTIFYTYRSHPFFEPYYSELEALLQQPWTRLIDLNMAIIHMMMGWLELKTQLVFASDLQVEGAKTELLLNICKSLHATSYLAGRSGRDYLDMALFDEAQIEVLFDEFIPPPYPQWNNPKFISHLSVLDLVFNCGAEKARSYMIPS